MLKLKYYASLTIIFFLSCTNCFATAETLRPEAEQELARSIYQQFIEIPSGYTTGATTPVVEAAAARLKTAGFSDADIFVGGASPKKANLVVRYRGTGEHKPILLLAHIDVVEAKRSDWSSNPFHFVERDGYFYGRGTTDDKAQAAVWLANLIQYKREGFKPNRDIILALTADEEGGGPYNGVAWLLKNHKDLINADFALNEGGVSEMLDGKKISNDLQVSEKYLLNFRLEVHNKGGHSSLPVADNAIYRLANALQRLSKFNFPLKTNEVTSAYLHELAKTETGKKKIEFTNAAANSQTAMQDVANISPILNATLRTTCTPTLLEGGHAMNALPQLAAANINCRVLPDETPEYVLQTLKKVIGDDLVIITLSKTNEFGKGPASPMNEDLLKIVTEVTYSFWPNVPTIPFMLMGATDGRYLRAAGIPTYGISGFFTDRKDIRAHGRDERMPVQSFYEGQAFLYDLVKRLSS